MGLAWFFYTSGSNFGLRGGCLVQSTPGFVLEENPLPLPIADRFTQTPVDLKAKRTLLGPNAAMVQSQMLRGAYA